MAKIKVKHFGATQTNRMSLDEGIKKYDKVLKWVKDQDTDTFFDVNLEDSKGTVIRINFAPKTKEIYVTSADDSKWKFPTKVYKVAKWEEGQIFFILSMLSLDFQRDEKLSTEQRVCYVFESILVYLESQE